MRRFMLIWRRTTAVPSQRGEERKIKFKKGSEKKRVREQRSEGREKLVSVDLVVKFVDEPVHELLLIL